MAPGRGCVFLAFPCRAGARESPSLSVSPAAPRAALFFPPPVPGLRSGRPVPGEGPGGRGAGHPGRRRVDRGPAGGRAPGERPAGRRRAGAGGRGRAAREGGGARPRRRRRESPT